MFPVLRKILTVFLLAFVVVSVGYAVGKELRLGRSRRAGAGDGAGAITVFYFHSTVRCVSCNAVERMTQEVLREDFASEVRSGRLVWRSEDFQKNEELARRYGVAFSSVVLVNPQGGFNRLEDVLMLADQPNALKQQLREAIRGQLGAGR